MDYRTELVRDAQSLALRLHNIRNDSSISKDVRQQEEDRIYQRLTEIAETIRQQPIEQRTPEIQAIYFAITEDGSPDVPSYVERLPIYTDTHRMFTKSPTTPTVNKFVRQFVVELDVMKPDEANHVLNNVQTDGPKQLLKALITNKQRSAWLKEGTEKCCRKCWSHVMEYLFQMMAEVLVVELKERSAQVQTMVQQNVLTEADALELAQYFEKTIDSVEDLLKDAYTQSHSRTEWAEFLESLYRIFVKMVNEIMSRYASFALFKKNHLASLGNSGLPESTSIPA